MSEQKMYRLVLNKDQLRAVCEALEEYFRVRLGQMTDLAEALTDLGTDLPATGENRSEVFNRWLERRDAAKIALDAAYRIATGDMAYRGTEGTKKSEQTMVCEDIWGVIRHRLWQDDPDKRLYTVDSRPPLRLSEHPLPVCEPVDEGGTG